MIQMTYNYPYDILSINPDVINDFERARTYEEDEDQEQRREMDMEIFVMKNAPQGMLIVQRPHMESYLYVWMQNPSDHKTNAYDHFYKYPIGIILCKVDDSSVVFLYGERDGVKWQHVATASGVNNKFYLMKDENDRYCIKMDSCDCLL